MLEKMVLLVLEQKCSKWWSGDRPQQNYTEGWFQNQLSASPTSELLTPCGGGVRIHILNRPRVCNHASIDICESMLDVVLKPRRRPQDHLEMAGPRSLSF